MNLNTVYPSFKKIICFLLIINLLSGCVTTQSESIINDEYTGGVWITYSELNTILDNGNLKENFNLVIKNCQSVKISDIYLHVRAFGDSIYKSEYFPLTEASKNYDYDILQYIIDECHKRGIRIHAWINPYRISNSTSDINTVNEKSPAYRWLKDEDGNNDRNVSICESGIYLNPAESQVRRLIIDGIREIITKYQIDGIHFDDYFYPTTDENFDKSSYDSYTSEGGTLKLSDWRRANVNSLIGGCYTAIKFTNKNIIFSISPAASIEKNYENLYADAAAWMSGGCVDYIIPQLYFGFEYPLEEYKFENLIDAWVNLADANGDIPLVIGLAPYKIGETSDADKEWSEREDILARQVECCRKNKLIIGYTFFSYSSLFSDKEQNKKQLTNIKEII